MKSKNLSFLNQLKAILVVAGLTFKIAPFGVIFKVIGSVINALLPIATTFYAAKTTTLLAEAFTGNKSAKSEVILYVIITSLLGLVMIAWNSVDTYMQERMRYVVETRISNNMYAKFLSLDYWRYDDKETVDLYDRAQKFTQFFSYVFDRLALIFTQIVSVLSAIIALVVINYFLAIIIFIAVMPGIYIQFKLSRKEVNLWNKNVGIRRRLNLIEWNMFQPQLISELRLYGMVRYLLNLRTDLKDKDEKKRIEFKKEILPLTLVANVLETAAELGSLIWITLQIIARKQAIGQFLYVQQMVSRAIQSSSSLVSALSSVDEDLANLYDYEQFMRLPSQQNGQIKLMRMPDQIEFNNVSFCYPNHKSQYVLKDINLKISKNQSIAIVGENGAGKSTLIKLLTGLYHPTKGQIYLDNISLHEIDINSWHQYLSLLHQNFISYYFATAKDNVRYGDIEKPFNKNLLNESLKKAEAYGFIYKLSRGIHTYLDNWMEDDQGNKGVALSGGQWQRLALARNFYRNTNLIILDEPTSAIDSLAESRIFKNLLEDDNKTIITVSHRLSTIKKVDQIYMIKDGSIIEYGNYKELVKLKGQFYEMFKSQITD